MCCGTRESPRTLGPETVAGQRSRPGKMESRGISATLRQRRSRVAHQMRCVSGASPALRQILRGSPHQTPWFDCGHPCGLQHSPTLEHFSSCSLTRLVGLAKVFAWKGELVLGICFKHGHDLTLNDLRDLILGWIQAGRIRSLADNPDSTFSRAPHRRATEPSVEHVVRHQNLLQSTCRILRSAIVN